MVLRRGRRRRRLVSGRIVKTAELIPCRGAHRFPHKRIVRKVLASRSARPCEVIDSQRPPGCAGLIPAEAPHLRVSIRPDRPGSKRWRTVRLCATCAVHLGLAEPGPSLELEQLEPADGGSS